MIGGDCRANSGGHTVDRDHRQGLGDDRRVVAVGVVAEEIQRRRGIFGQIDIIVIGDRRYIVAGTGDFQRQGRRVAAAIAVGNGVGEDLDAGVAVIQRFGVGIEVVEGIFPGAVGSDGERAIAAGDDLGEGRIDDHVRAGLAGAGIDIGDGQNVACIDIAIVVQNVARSAVVAGNAEPLFDQTIRGVGVGHGNRAVIGTGNGNCYRLGYRTVLPVINCVGEGVCRRFARGKIFELAIRVVAEGAITVVGDSAHGANRINGKRVGV